MFNECHIHLCDCTLLNVFSHAQFLLIKHKDFLVFQLFLENILFLQKLSKSSKTVLPCSGDSVAGQFSHMPQSRAHTEIFRYSLAGQCPSHEKYLEYFSKFGFLMFLAAQSGYLFAGGRSSRGGAQKFSRLTLRLPHGQNFQSKKTLRKFFKIFVLSVLAIGPGNLLATLPNRENHVFCAIGQFLKPFEFPLNIL